MLSELEMRVLAFERRGWRSPARKEQAISDVLGLTGARYYQLLNELIDRAEALEFDPVLVKRLQAQRARRAAVPLSEEAAVIVEKNITPTGRAGLTALLDQPRDALIGLDFDGTLAPIVPDPRAARAHPGAVPALKRLAGCIGTLAVITGRPAADAVAYGGLAEVPGIVVLGQYGAERWQDGRLTEPEPSAAIDQARQRLPGLLRDAGAPDGTWIEDKRHALAVHTRRTQDPQAALALLRGPLSALAAGLGLVAEPGRLVVELRHGGVDKGAVLTGLVRETTASSAMFCGDDVGDLPAFAAIRAMRGAGIPGCAVASLSRESAEVAAQADLVVDGPAGVVRLLGEIADALLTKGG